MSITYIYLVNSYLDALIDRNKLTKKRGKLFQKVALKVALGDGNVPVVQNF